VAPPQLQGWVLVAEDNPINQALVRAMLHKLGLQLTLVGDGAQAVQAMRERDFDLVLMDCQMPVMDGYEATALIRAFALPKVRTTPIIAVTANAMAGDREKCLSAGMDDFLAKPFTLTALRQMLVRWLPGAGQAQAGATPVLEAQAAAEGGAAAAQARAQPIKADILASLRELDEHGGPGLARQLFGYFVDNARASDMRIEAALASDDAPALVSLAHGLKSSCASIGAQALANGYRELEKLARANQLPAARAKLPSVRDEQQRVLLCDLDIGATHAFASPAAGRGYLGLFAG
jgi:two-component system, sensor histidine kinase and response regulator